jgi:hypothetical protein
MATSAFSATYAEARAKFLEAAVGASAEFATWSHPERGPDGGELAADVAWIGPVDATAVLVMVSGTHGVEGHCGSGAQIDWLRRGEAARLAAGQAVMLVHAINPYGFAWSRRVTHENVDLNRNFVDFAKPLPENPGYDELAEVIAPAEWTDASRQASRAAFLAYLRQHSYAALVEALSGGQYRHPGGVYYGGAAETWSRRTLTAIFQQRLGQARHVGVLDYHTGLGPEGFGEQMVSAAPHTAEYARATAWYGTAVTSIEGGNSSSAKLTGDWLDATPALLPHAQVTGMALEYGTVDGAQVMEALRADNWVQLHGDPLSPQGRAIAADTRAAFYIDTDIWRGMVLGQSLVATRQALAGLSRTV